MRDKNIEETASPFEFMLYAASLPDDEFKELAKELNIHAPTIVKKESPLKSNKSKINFKKILSTFRRIRGITKG